MICVQPRMNPTTDITFIKEAIVKFFSRLYYYMSDRRKSEDVN